MPSSVLSWSSPYKVLMKSEPDYSRLKVIGCLCYAAISDNFAPRALRCVFLGYPCAQKAYKLYDLDNHIIIISRDVLFKKHIFPYKTFSSTFVDSSHCSVNYFFKNLDTSHCTDHQSDVHNHTTTPVHLLLINQSLLLLLFLPEDLLELLLLLRNLMILLYLILILQNHQKNLKLLMCLLILSCLVLVLLTWHLCTRFFLFMNLVHTLKLKMILCGFKQWRRNYKSWKRIIHGNEFICLLSIKQLDVNGFI